MDVAKISSGLMFNPLQNRKIIHMGQVPCRHSRYNFNTYHGYSKNLMFQHKLYSSGLTTRSFVVTKASIDPSDSASKSGFSVSIIGILKFILKILGFLEKEKKLIEEVKDGIEDIGKVVVEVIEDVTEIVEKVSENIPEDAEERRELKDKVGAIRSDIDTAIDNLEGATEPGNAKEGKASTANIGAAAKEAAQTAEGVKKAVEELKQKEVKEVPSAKFQAVDVTNATSKRLWWAVMLATIAVLINNWWLPEITYASLLKYLPSLINKI